MARKAQPKWYTPAQIRAYLIQLETAIAKEQKEYDADDPRPMVELFPKTAKAIAQIMRNHLHMEQELTGEGK